MKPDLFYCEKCKEWVQGNSASADVISYYVKSELVERSVWTAKCKTCKDPVIAFDIPAKKIGKGEMCVNCGTLIFPAGKTVKQALADLAAADVATIHKKDKILKSRGVNI